MSSEDLVIEFLLRLNANGRLHFIIHSHGQPPLSRTYPPEFFTATTPNQIRQALYTFTPEMFSDIYHWLERPETISEFDQNDFYL